jgi:hypothetical protein
MIISPTELTQLVRVEEENHHDYLNFMGSFL